MSIDETPPPTRQAIAVIDRSAPGKVTGKLKVALQVMVWEGLKRADAATKAGMTDHGLREALRRPHVKRFYLDELDVLRTSERARNFLAMREVRDQDSNQMAKLNAAQAMDREADQSDSPAAQRQSPGLTIVIEGAVKVQSGAQAVRTIEHDANE